MFPFFALFVIFSDELFHCFFIINGSSSVGSGIKAYMAIFVSLVVYTLLLKDIFVKRLNYNSFFLLLLLFSLFFLYYLTQFFYPPCAMQNDYIAHLLLFGSMCVPAGYVGMRLSRKLYNEMILTLLPLFIIFVSLAIGVAQYFILLEGKLLDSDNAVLNYQQASYYFAYCFSFGIFYLFFVTKKKSLLGKIIVIMTVLTILLTALGCATSGGRGGFVYLGFILIFLIYRIVKHYRKARIKIGICLILMIILLLSLLSYYDISDSRGFIRITESATDGGRFYFQHKALNAFKESPLIGNGLGSIWWTVGFYSHNIITDLLAETGLVGTLLMLFLLIKQFYILNKRSFVSNFDLFILLIFLGVGTQSLFSGYWFAMPNYFLAFGYTFGSSIKKHNSHV